MAYPTVAETHLAPKIREAEQRIQAILLRLVNDHDARIEAVEVDTRRFGNLAVSILAEPRT